MSIHQVGTKNATTSNNSKRGDLPTKIVYVFYFTYMILLNILGTSHEITASVLEIIWIKKFLLIANFIGILLCIYLIINNKHKALWIMRHMPAWLLRLEGILPVWMKRYCFNHRGMRIMMVSCDLMLIWMCVGFGMNVIMQFGW